MIRAKLSFVAEVIVQDKRSDTISAFNIFDGLVPAGYPFFLQHVSYYALFEREQADPEQVEGEFTMTLEDEVLGNAPLAVDFAGQLRYRSIVQLNGLVVPRPGLLRFRVALPGDIHADYVIRAEPAPPAQVIQGQENAQQTNQG